jgi:hypothetical protein
MESLSLPSPLPFFFFVLTPILGKDKIKPAKAKTPRKDEKTEDLDGWEEEADGSWDEVEEEGEKKDAGLSDLDAEIQRMILLEKSAKEVSKRLEEVEDGASRSKRKREGELGGRREQVGVGKTRKKEGRRGTRKNKREKN